MVDRALAEGRCVFYFNPGYDGLGAVLSRGLVANLTAVLWGCRASCPMPRRRLANTVAYANNLPKRGALYCHSVRDRSVRQDSQTYGESWLATMRCWDAPRASGAPLADWLPCAAAESSNKDESLPVTCKITKAFITDTLVIAKRVVGGRMNSARANAHANAHIRVEEARDGLERLRRASRASYGSYGEGGQDDRSVCGFAPVSKSEQGQVIEIAVHLRLGDRASLMAPLSERLAPLRELARAADQVGRPHETIGIVACDMTNSKYSLACSRRLCCLHVISLL